MAHFPSISYYFHIPKFFDYLDFHCPNLEKIGIDEKVICYHNISNLLWKKDVLCVRKKSESQKHYSSDLKNFANSRPSASNFKSFSQSLEQFFLTVGQNNFGNKIPFLK